MGESTNKSDGQETRATLPKLFGVALAEGTESVLHAQAGWLADIEETLVASLRWQQESLRKALELIDESRGGGTLADHFKRQLAVSEHYVNNGLSLWRDATNKWSERTLKQLESGQKTMLAATADERGAALNMVDKHQTSIKGAARRAAEAA